MKIAIDKIKPSPFQPRLEFDLEDSIRESIAKDGILIPIVVRKVNEHYELIDGERRLRLAKELNHENVPCDVVEANDEEADRWIWELNERRKPYEPKERALRYKRFQKQGMTQIAIAEMHNESHFTVNMYLGVFKLPLKYQKLVWNKRIGVSIVKEILPHFGKQNVDVYNQVIQILDRVASDSSYGRIQVKKDLEKLNEKISEAGQEIAVALTDVKIETPEDYDKAAEVLKKEAKKKREVTAKEMAPEDKIKLEAQKQKKKEEKNRKAVQKRREKEALLQEKAEEIAKDKLMNNKKFQEEVKKEAKQDLSKSDIEALEKLKDNSDLTSEDKKTIRELIMKGDIRGKKQIEDEIEIYRKERAKGRSAARSTVNKKREIKKHLERIEKAAVSLSNLLTVLSAQIRNYPETLQFIPPAEASRVSLALTSLGLTVREFRKTCEDTNEEGKKKIKAIGGKSETNESNSPDRV